MKVPGFSVDVRRDGATVVVAPQGEVDLATVAALRAALDGVGACDVLVLDLRGVEFIDSSAIGLIVDEHRRAEQEGSTFRVVSGPNRVQRLLEMTGLARRIEVVEPGGESDGLADEGATVR
jgi:anti-anti-sigma factor